MPTPTEPDADIKLADLQQVLDTGVAPWVRQIGLELVSAQGHEVVCRVPIVPLMVHRGQVLCGQAIMAAADTVMVLAITLQQGRYRPMTTVQLQTSFLRPVPGSQTEAAGHARLVGRVLRAGRNLVFGEIELFDTSERLAAHATTTYALL